MNNKTLIALLALVLTINLTAQETPNVVFTGAPFLRIPPDARAGGLGDQGVATSPDAFSQYWNPAKYLFGTSYSGVGVAYTPYLSNLTDDVFLLNGSYYTFLGDEERSTLGINLYYFNLGQIDLNGIVNDEIVNLGTAKPNEFAISASYGLKLADTFGMAVGLSYIRSDLFNGVNTTEDVQAASSVAVNIGGYYQSERHYFRNFEGKLRLGFSMSNIGPKLDYSSSDDNQAYLPTTLRLGAGYDFIFDEYSRLGVTYETSKLMVPTPDIPQYTDANGNGVQDPDEPTIGYSQDTSQGVVGSIFSSFGDAPGGASEEFQEFTHSLAIEYSYNQALFLRTGYFYEAPQKGDRQHLTLGLGLKLNAFGIDASYLIPVSDTNSALENTLRFALTFDIGGEAYSNVDY